jgi:hypothetical protein
MERLVVKAYERQKSGPVVHANETLEYGEWR